MIITVIYEFVVSERVHSHKEVNYKMLCIIVIVPQFTTFPERFSFISFSGYQADL